MFVYACVSTACTLCIKWDLRWTVYLLDMSSVHQQQNEQRCEKEIEDIKRGVQSGNITPDTSLIRFSDDALDEQKHSIRIADEKVALAARAYDMVCDATTAHFFILTLILIQLKFVRRINYYLYVACYSGVSINLCYIALEDLIGINKFFTVVFPFRM